MIHFLSCLSTSYRKKIIVIILSGFFTATQGFAQSISVSANVPSESSGEYFDAEFELFFNMSTTTGVLYLDVSEKGGVQSFEILDHNEFDASYLYPPGSEIYYNGGGDNTMTSTHWLASAWNYGNIGIENLKLKIRIYPNQSGPIYLFFRASYITDDNEIRNPSTLGYLDQQGWLCNRSLTYNSPLQLTNVRISSISVNGGNQVYAGEEVKIEVAIEETNGVNAGKVDVYYLVDGEEIEDPDDITKDLLANESTTEYEYHIFPSPGNYEVMVQIDKDDKIPEDNENDNDKTISISVLSNSIHNPQITVSDPPSELFSGNSYTIEWATQEIDVAENLELSVSWLNNSQILTSSTPNDGEYLWQVDEQLPKDQDMSFVVTWHSDSEDIQGKSKTFRIIAPTPPTQVELLEIGNLKIFADQIEEISTGQFQLMGNVSINNILFFDGTLGVDKGDMIISGEGRLFLSNILKLNEVDLYNGNFKFDVSNSQDKITKNLLADSNNQLDILNLPIYISEIEFLEDGIGINGSIQLPKVLGSVNAEITQIKLTKSEGLSVIGGVELEDGIKILNALSLKKLSLQFDSDKNEFTGSGEIEKKPLFTAGAGIRIIETGLDSVGVYVDLNRPQPLGSTGLELIGANGFVDNIQKGPLVVSLGTRLKPVGVNPEFISFDSLTLTYKLGTSMTGKGNFVLFNQKLADAYFEIENEKIAIGVNLNFEDMLLAYMNASIIKNSSDDIDFIGNFGGELIIPNKDGFKFKLYESLLRKALKDETLTLPITLAGTDNVIFNAELSGRAWIARPGKKDFKISYLIKYENGQIERKFDTGFRLFNEEIFVASTTGRYNLEFMNLPNPESELEGKSLILRNTSISHAKTNSENSVTRDFVIDKNVETIVIRAKNENAIPALEITDPNGNVINKLSNFQNYDYVTNDRDNSAFIIIDSPFLGTYSLTANFLGDSCLVDVVGNESEPSFRINNVNHSGEGININWTDNNPYDNANISLYYDTDQSGADGKLIVSKILEDNQSNTYLWMLNKEMPGLYYIYGIMKDTLGNYEISYFDTPIEIQSKLAGPTNLSYHLENNIPILEWNRSEDCINCDYLIFNDHSQNISTFSPNQNVGDTTSYDLSDLVYGRTYSLAVAARNEDGVLTSLSNIVEVALISSQTNNLPTIESVEYPPSIRKGESTKISFDLWDADEDSLTLEIIKSPSDISVSSNTINWTAKTLGKNQFYIRVSDQDGAGDSIQFFINVYEDFQFLPSINTDKLQLTNYGESVEISLRNLSLLGTEVASDTIEAYAVSNPSKIIDLKLVTVNADNGVFGNSLILDKRSNASSNTLQVSKKDTLVLSYKFDDQAIHYRVFFNGPNSNPTDILLSSDTIRENEDIGTKIGDLITKDYDENDSFEYEIISGGDLFQIENNTLISNTVFDVEESTTETLRIKTTDQEGGTYSKSFEITVLNVNDIIQGINDGVDQSILVYPNPIREYLFIDWDQFDKATIFGLSGNKFIESSNSTLDTRTLGSGIYLIRIEGKNGKLITLRLIKK